MARIEDIAVTGAQPKLGFSQAVERPTSAKTARGVATAIRARCARIVKVNLVSTSPNGGSSDDGLSEAASLKSSVLNGNI
jgi:hypothetical protein